MLPSLLARRAALLGAAPFLTHVDHRAALTPRTLSWAQADAAADAVAAWTCAHTRPGDRVAVLAPQGPEWVTAFLGVLRAGRVAVPLHAPSLPVGAHRLTDALAAAAPAAALTTRAELRAVRGLPAAAIDDLPPAHSHPSDVTAADPAYLRPPFVITHGEALAQARRCAQAAPGTVAVSWLPLWHEPGLRLAVTAPVVTGALVVLLDPVAFLEKPVRWLHALADHPGAVTAAPDDAYTLTADRVTGTERANLDLTSVSAMLSDTLSDDTGPGADRFHRLFGTPRRARPGEQPLSRERG